MSTLGRQRVIQCLYEGVRAGSTDNGMSTLGRHSVIQCLYEGVIAGNTDSGMSTFKSSECKLNACMKAS